MWSLVVAVPRANLIGNASRVVAHRKVIALRDDILLCGGEQPLPLRLKAEWVVTLAENRQQRQRAKWAGKRPRHLVVDSVAEACVAKVVVKCAHAERESFAIGDAAARIQMPSDTK